MRQFTFGIVLAVLVALSTQSGSPVPNCFVCPPQDLAGRPLIAHSESSSELFCRFQSVPNDFFCKYFIDTGLEKQDHDDGFCPPVAGIDCSARRRRNVLPRSPRPPQPGARSVPDSMKARSKLKRTKYIRD